MKKGFTLIEVLVGMTILGITLSIFAAAVATSARMDQVSGQRTQAAQVMGLIGRYVTQGINEVLPAVSDESKSWNYGELSNLAASLEKQKDFADPDLYRAEVLRRTPITFFGTTTATYQVTVCWQTPEEICVRTLTAGPAAPPPVGSAPASFVN